MEIQIVAAFASFSPKESSWLQGFATTQPIPNHTPLQTVPVHLQPFRGAATSGRLQSPAASPP